MGIGRLGMTSGLKPSSRRRNTASAAKKRYKNPKRSEEECAAYYAAYYAESNRHFEVGFAKQANLKAEVLRTANSAFWNNYYGKWFLFQWIELLAL